MFYFLFSICFCRKECLFVPFDNAKLRSFLHVRKELLLFYLRFVATTRKKGDRQRKKPRYLSQHNYIQYKFGSYIFFS